MEVRFDVQMTTSKLYDFNLQHSYKKPISIIASAVGVVFLFLFLQQLKWYYLAAALLLIFYLPVSLLRSSFMKVKMIDFFKEPVSYLLNDDGITVFAQGEEQTVPWSDCVKACNTRQSYFVYTGRNSAFIFPKKDMGDKTGDVLMMINTHMDPAKVKIKFGGL
ncbi:MAG: YcxB family protein [Lachnospiraceae bacterium]|nr:YcxB family protein [Lachnospiraceae bacterium]